MDVDLDDVKYKSLDGDDIANFQDIDNSAYLTIGVAAECHVPVVSRFTPFCHMYWFLLQYRGDVIAVIDFRNRIIYILKVSNIVTI
jgi:hypothetical protein